MRSPFLQASLECIEQSCDEVSCSAHRLIALRSAGALEAGTLSVAWSEVKLEAAKEKMSVREYLAQARRVVALCEIELLNGSVDGLCPHHLFGVISSLVSQQ